MMCAGFRVSGLGVRSQKVTDWVDARRYVSKIKQRFAHQQTVYQQFLQILQRYKEEGFAIAKVKAQVDLANLTYLI